ncbi:hypothetical protein TcG_07484 [Trypanosoma cruzi]|nr:hypothetical protein TcG_07484 [Trypanosoma cruzi]
MCLWAVSVRMPSGLPHHKPHSWNAAVARRKAAPTRSSALRAEQGGHCEGRAASFFPKCRVMMEPCGFQAARCGWLTAEALGHKAPPRVSHRGKHRNPCTSTVSRRGRSCANNTAPSILPLFGARATIPLAF